MSPGKGLFLLPGTKAESHGYPDSEIMQDIGWGTVLEWKEEVVEGSG